MRVYLSQFARGFQIFWHGLRQWCGDSAYESYLASAKRQCATKPLSATEFYVEQLNRRYSRPNRCC